MVKLAFFDIDGTLSAPRYRDGAGASVIGFSPEEWPAYCAREGENAYRDCSPVPCVRRFAEALAGQGARLYALSTSLSEAESRAKAAFVRRHYPSLFEAVLMVGSDEEKLTVIAETARKNGAALPDCMLVEDTYATLLKAHAAGIAAVHISNIIAGNISG